MSVTNCIDRLTVNDTFTVKGTVDCTVAHARNHNTCNVNGPHFQARPGPARPVDIAAQPGPTRPGPLININFYAPSHAAGKAT